jgi:hypothetical protein
MTHESTKGVEVFYSYAHKDENLRNALMEHLSTLREQGYISEWYDRRRWQRRQREKDISTHELEIIEKCINNLNRTDGHRMLSHQC